MKLNMCMYRCTKIYRTIHVYESIIIRQLCMSDKFVWGRKSPTEPSRWFNVISRDPDHDTDKNCCLLFGLMKDTTKYSWM